MKNPLLRRGTVGVGICLVAAALAAQAAAQPAPAPPAAPVEAETEQGAEPPTSASVVRELPSGAGEMQPVFPMVPGGLSADTVARRSVASSATVRAKLAEVAAARASITQTLSAQYLPRLTLRAAYTRLSPQSQVRSTLGSGALVGAANPGFLTTGPCPTGTGQCVLDSAGQPVGAAQFDIRSLENNYALTVQLIVPISDYVTQLRTALAGSEATKQAAVFAHRAERLKVQSDARIVYYSWVMARGQVAVAESSLKRVQARERDANAAYTLGTISKADLMRLEALLANTELSVAEARTTERLSAEQLAIVMGDETPGAYQIGEDVMAPPRTNIDGSLGELTAEAFAKRLELKALNATRTALREGAKAASVGRWPRLEANAELTYANPNPRYFPPTQRWDATWSAGFSATWTLSDLVSGGASSDELAASARSTEAQRAALSDGIRREVAAAYLNREKLRVAVRTSARAVVAAEEAYRVATDLYQVGRATTTEVIDAEADLFAARLGQLNAKIGLRIAESQLKHAVGRDI